MRHFRFAFSCRRDTKTFTPHLLQLARSITTKCTPLHDRRNNAQYTVFDVDILNPLRSPPLISTLPALVDAITAFFDRFTYSYCIFDAPTMLAMVSEMGQTSMMQRPETIMKPPHLLIRFPHLLDTFFGEERRRALEDVLWALFEEMEAAPLFSLRRQTTLEDVSPALVTFLRGLCLGSSVHHPFAAQASHVLETLLVEGCVTDLVFLEGEYQDRVLTLSRLLMALSLEFGSTVFLSASLSLMRQAGVEVDYETSKWICRALSREERRLLDWSLKGSPPKYRRMHSRTHR